MAANNAVDSDSVQSAGVANDRRATRTSRKSDRTRVGEPGVPAPESTTDTPSKRNQREGTAADETVPWTDDVCTRIAAGLEATYRSGPEGVEKALRSSHFEAVLCETLVLVSGISLTFNFLEACGHINRVRPKPAAFIDVLKDEHFQRSVRALSEKPRTFASRLLSQAKPDSERFPLYGNVPVMLLASGESDTPETTAAAAPNSQAADAESAVTAPDIAAPAGAGDVAPTPHADDGTDSQKERSARDGKTSSVSMLMARKVSPAEFHAELPFNQMALDDPTPSVAGADVAWTKPTVVTGSSGSGKTDFMITGGSKSPAAVLYTRAGDFERAFEDAKDTEDRDAKFNEHFGRMIDRATPSLFPVEDAEKKMKFGHDETSVVRVVVDEAGSGSDAARALIRQSAAVCELVARKLSVKESEVQTVVGGTGSASPDKPWGSEPSAYGVVNMDSFGMSFSVHFRKSLPGSMLEYLDNPKASPSSAAAWEYRAMLSNPRLAALLVNHAKSLAKHRQRALVAKYPPLACEDGGRLEQSEVTMGVSVSGRATLSALDAMTGFFLLNGLEDLVAKNRTDRIPAELRDLPGPGALVTVLARALAIDVGCYDGIADPSMQEQLLTRFGVLQDRAEEADTAETGFRSVPAAHQSDDADAQTKEKVLVVPLDCRGRFVMPPAYRAMLLRLWFGDAAAGLHEADAMAEWELFEQYAWRWAAVLTACVTAERSLEDLVVLSSAGRLYSATDTSGPLLPAVAEGDPMASYRGAMFTDLKVRPAATMERCVVGDRSRPRAAAAQSQRLLPDLCPEREGSMDLSGVKHGVALIELRKAMPYATSESVGKPFLPSLFADDKPVSRPLGVAMLNAPRAPFADVVAHTFDRDQAKPSGTVLVQVKWYGTGDPKVDDEVAKIGALTAAEQNQEAAAVDAAEKQEAAAVDAAEKQEAAAAADEEHDPSATSARTALQKRAIVRTGVAKLCQNHGLFVAIVAAPRCPNRISAERAEAAEDLLKKQPLAAPDVTAPPALVPRAVVLHLKTTRQGVWVAQSAEDQKWTRPPLFPLILGDQTPAHMS